MEHLKSDRAKGVKRSAIRELLKLTERPEIISFAGGLPNPETFPSDTLAQIAEEEIGDNYSQSLQYGTTEGLEQFRSGMINWLQHDCGLELSIDETMVTTASQQAIHLASMTYLNPGDVLFCGLPTYLGAIQSFTAFQADSRGIPLREDGMNLDVLEQRIREAKQSGKTPKIVYVVPDFQNPSGVTMSRSKRKRLVKIAKQQDLLIIEDSPYFCLRYKGEQIPPIQSFDEDGRVLSFFSLSKMLSPGLRLALVGGDESLIKDLVKLKQAADLCTPTLTQRLAARWLKTDRLSGHVEQIRYTYEDHLDAMLESLNKEMPAHEEVSWTTPAGGLFVWLTLPEEINTTDLFHKSVEEDVAFVPGEHFFVNDEGQNTMRLSFSLVGPDKIATGISRLGEVIKQELPMMV